MNGQSANILAQLAIPAGVETVLFTVSGTTRCQVQGFTFCNNNSTFNSFRLAFCPLGVVNHPADWVYFDIPMPGNDTLLYEVDLTLNVRDTVLVFSTNGGVSVTLYGQVV